MKTVLKFLYIIIVFFAIMLIQQSGGASGMRVSQYMSDNFHLEPENPNYTVAVISGVLGTYGDANPDNWTNIDISTPDGRFDFTITLIPFGGRFNQVLGPQIHNGVEHYLEIRADGFFIWLSRDDSTDYEFSRINLIFNTINLDAPNEAPISTSIWVQRAGGVGTQAFPMGWAMFSYVENVLMANITRRYGENPPLNIMDFSTLGNYNTNQLVVTVDTLNNEYIFRASEPGAQRPIINLVQNAFDGFVADDFISEQLMFFSARLFPDQLYESISTETLEELAEADVVLFITPDLSPYWWWFLVIWSIYVLLALVIPYFWMFRKPLKEALAVRKEAKKRQAIAKQKTAGSPASGEKKFKTVQEGQRLKEQQKQSQNTDSTPIVTDEKPTDTNVNDDVDKNQTR